MKAIRSAALSRQAAPSFLMVGPDELRRLRLVGHLARSLFLELVALADHRTGAVRTSYAVLLALLDFDQVPGAHAADKPTTKRLRTALEHLEAVRLVLRDTRANERDKALRLSIAPRVGIGAPEAGKGSRTGRDEKPAKPASARVPRPRRGKEGQTEGQGVQEREISTPTPSTASYPQTRTDQAQPIANVLRGLGAATCGVVQPGELEAAHALALSRGEKWPPPGGTEVAPSGRTPPRASRWVQEARAALRKRHHQAPPGGQDEERPPEGTLELEAAAGGMR